MTNDRVAHLLKATTVDATRMAIVVMAELMAQCDADNMEVVGGHLLSRAMIHLTNDLTRMAFEAGEFRETQY